MASGILVTSTLCNYIDDATTYTVSKKNFLTHEPHEQTRKFFSWVTALTNEICMRIRGLVYWFLRLIPTDLLDPSDQSGQIGENTEIGDRISISDCYDLHTAT